MKTVQLDISVPLEPKDRPVIYTRQDAAGYQFQVLITDYGEPYPIAPDTRMMISYFGTCGEGNYSFIDERSAFTIQDNIVTVELHPRMLAAAGGGYLSLTLFTPDGLRKPLDNLWFEVEGVAGADSEAAVPYYDAFLAEVQKLMAAAAQVEQAAAAFTTDETLSLTGAAADAAAVGAALALKAPAGYGLGASSVYTADCDSAATNGWYYIGSETANRPAEISYGTLFALTRTSQEKVQILFDVVKGYIARRLMQSGKWNEWEYINPPMSAGVEYHTTERYNGATVYAKCISYTPSGTVGGLNSGKVDVSFPHDISNFGELVSASAKIASLPLPAISGTGGLATLHSVTASSISIRLYNTELTGTFIIFMRYTKS